MKNVRIQPLPKNVNKTLPAICRPITRVPNISNVIEKSLNRAHSNIIKNRQYCFRSRRYIEERKSRTVVLDISKHFDQV